MNFQPVEGKHYEIGITDVASTAPCSTPKYPFYMAYDKDGLHTAVIICQNENGLVAGRAFPLRKDAVQATGGAYRVEFKADYPEYMQLGWCSDCAPPLRKAIKRSAKAVKLMGEFDHWMVGGLSTFLKKRDCRVPAKIDPFYTLSQKEKQQLAISNHVILKAAGNIMGFFYRDMKAAADPELVAIANRFPFRVRCPEVSVDNYGRFVDPYFADVKHKAHRYDMYVFLCTSGKYAEQMCRVFPVIAQLAVFDKNVARMVTDGRRIKDIIDAVNAEYNPFKLTMGMKSVRPQLAGWLLNNSWAFTLAPKPLIPKDTDSLAQQRLKFDTIPLVETPAGNPYEGNFPVVLARVIERWGNKRALPVLAGRYNMERFVLHAIDWARRPEHGDIDKHMSPEKLAEKIDEWDAVLARPKAFTGEDAMFPLAWIPDQDFAVKKNKYKFQYIRSKSELHDEGAAMSHCVSGYANYVINGTSQIYSVRDSSGKRIATAEIKMCSTVRIKVASGEPAYPESPVKFTIEQIRGKCNRDIPPEIKAGAQRLISKHNAKLDKEHKQKMIDRCVQATAQATVGV